MWPLGHAAIAYLLYTLWIRSRSSQPPTAIPIAFLLVGSQFPDLVDKPLAWYLDVLPTGRTLAHSLLVLVPLCVLVAAVAAHYDRLEYGTAFGLGALSHALVDALPVLWGGTEANFLLWPLLSVEPYESGAPSIIDLFVSSLGDPYFLAEFVLAGLAFVAWRHDGYPGLELVADVLPWPTRETDRSSR